VVVNPTRHWPSLEGTSHDPAIARTLLVDLLGSRWPVEEEKHPCMIRMVIFRLLYNCSMRCVPCATHCEVILERLTIVCGARTPKMPSCATIGCAHTITTLHNPDEDGAWLCDQHQRELDVACG
jgi:hypothetical protein